MCIFSIIKKLPLKVAFFSVSLIFIIIGIQLIGGDASEVEVIYSNPYKALTLDELTDWECETAQLIVDNRDGKLVRTDDPRFFPDSVPVLEPVDCEVGDTECEEANKNAGKSAH